MATDWPGHGAVNRHVHYPARCACSILFTEDNEPPWFYESENIFETGPGAWWLWMNAPLLLYPFGEENLCVFLYQLLDPFNNNFLELRLLLEIQASEPDQIVATLRATRIAGLQSTQYTNQIATGVIPGPRAPRPTIWLFPLNNWVKVVDEPAVIGPPTCFTLCAPKDCVPNWNWGTPLPPLGPVG